MSFQTQKEVPVGLPGNSLNKNNAVKGSFTHTITLKAISAITGKGLGENESMAKDTFSETFPLMHTNVFSPSAIKSKG